VIVVVLFLEEKMARRGLSFRRRRRMSLEKRQIIRNYLIGCISAFLLGVLLVISFGYTITNVGISMQETIAHNQKILVNRTKYILFAPRVSDVIVFKKGSNEHIYIKRVVARPGDTVQIVDGHLYVNDVLAKNKYDKIANAGIAKEKITLLEDEFFVLGDNRNNSEDSRFDTIGPVHRTEIIGKAWFALPSEEESMKTIR